MCCLREGGASGREMADPTPWSGPCCSPRPNRRRHDHRERALPATATPRLPPLPRLRRGSLRCGSLRRGSDRHGDYRGGDDCHGNSPASRTSPSRPPFRGDNRGGRDGHGHHGHATVETVTVTSGSDRRGRHRQHRQRPSRRLRRLPLMPPPPRPPSAIVIIAANRHHRATTTRAALRRFTGGLAMASRFPMTSPPSIVKRGRCLTDRQTRHASPFWRRCCLCAGESTTQICRVLFLGADVGAGLSQAAAPTGFAGLVRASTASSETTSGWMATLLCTASRTLRCASACPATYYGDLQPRRGPPLLEEVHYRNRACAGVRAVEGCGRLPRARVWRGRRSA